MGGCPECGRGWSPSGALCPECSERAAAHDRLINERVRLLTQLPTALTDAEMDRALADYEDELKGRGDEG